MGLLFGFLTVIAFIGGLVYVFLVQRAVPGLMEQRFGTLEALPVDVGEWKTDDESEEGRLAALQGLRREIRLFHDPGGGLLGNGSLVRQTRYRNPATNAITRVEPDVPVARRRIRH